MFLTEQIGTVTYC